jgi:hypothetical protein
MRASMRPADAAKARRPSEAVPVASMKAAVLAGKDVRFQSKPRRIQCATGATAESGHRASGWWMLLPKISRPIIRDVRN